MVRVNQQKTTTKTTKTMPAMGW